MSERWSPRNEAVGGLGGGLYCAPGQFRIPSPRNLADRIDPIQTFARRELRRDGVLRSSVYHIETYERPGSLYHGTPAQER